MPGPGPTPARTPELGSAAAGLGRVRAVRAAGKRRFAIELEVKHRVLPGRRLALLRAGARIATVQVVASAGNYVWVGMLPNAEAPTSILAGDQLGPPHR